MLSESKKLALRKLAETNRGRKLSAEHRFRISQSKAGKKQTAKQAAINRGRKHSKEEIEKRRIAITGVKKTTPAVMAAPSHHKSKKGVLRDAHGRVWFFTNYRDFVRTHPQLFNADDLAPRQRIQSGRISYWCRAEKGIAGLFKKGKRVSGSWKGWTVAFSIMERAEGGGDLLGRDYATVVELAK